METPLQPARKKGHVVAIALGALVGVGVLAGGSYAAYRWYTRGRPSPATKAYDMFRRVRTASSGVTATDCQATCTADATCTAYSTKDSDGTCATTKLDPYPASNWTDDPAWTTFVKRDEAAPASSWSDWTQCDAACEQQGKRARTCQGAGKCVGSPSVTCTGGTCDTFEPLPSGFIFYPEDEKTMPTFSLYHTNDESTCQSKCIGDSTCTGYTFQNRGVSDLTSMNCIAYTSPLDAVVVSPSPLDPGDKYAFRHPLTSGTWAAWPGCKCGVTKVARTCTTGTNCVGPHVELCAGTPCLYDKFSGVKEK
jgi:hypothetical protein